MGAGRRGDPLSERIEVAVFSRLDSNRLPGKALLDIGGRPMVARVVERAARIDGVDGVVLATTERDVDEPLVEWAAGAGVPVVRGATDDVLGRCLAVARARHLDAVVRVSGDSPFLDPEVGAAIVARYRRDAPDLATNLAPRSWPPGCSVEVVSTALLERLDGLVTDPEHREHVTQWCYAHPDEVRVVNVETSPAITGRLVVDEPDDLARARWLVDELGPRADVAGVAEVVAAASRWPGVNPAGGVEPG